MNNWVYLRLGIVALSFLQGVVWTPSLFGDAPGRGEGSIQWGPVLLFFLFPMVALLFIIGIQFFNPRSASAWRYPSWKINPFLLSEPLQPLHFLGFVFLATGLGALTRGLLTRSLISDALAIASFGAGTVLGVYLCTLVFRRRMAHDT